MRVTQLMLIAVSGLVLAGCPKKPTTLPDASNTTEQTGAETNRAGENDVTGRNTDSSEILREAAKQAGTLIYFDYDRAEIKPEFVPIVTAHAKYLNANAPTRCGSRVTRTSAARASTTSASVSAARRQCAAH